MVKSSICPSIILSLNLLGLPLLCAEQTVGAGSEPSVSGKDLGAKQTVTLTLRQSVALALENNLGLDISSLDMAIAEAGILIANSKFEPELQSTWNYQDATRPRSAESVAATGISSSESRVTTWETGITGLLPTGADYELSVNNQGEESTFNNFTPQWDASAGLSVNQPLLRGFGTDIALADIRVARRDRAMADSIFLQTMMTLVEEVSTAYYNLLFRQADLRAQRENLALAQQLVEDNRTREEIGDMSGIDVLQAENELATSRQDLIAAERALLDAGAELKRLLYRDLTPVLTLQIVPETTAPPLLVADVGQSVILALRNRPELVEQELLLEQQGIQLRVARNELLPQVDLRGSYEFLGQDRTFGSGFERATEGDNPVWSVGVVFTLPLGLGEERGRARQAKLELEQQYLRLLDSRQDVVLQVDNAVRAVRSNRLAYEVAQEATALARRTYEAELERLRAGTTTTYVVSQLQRDLALARTRELRSRADWYISLVNLARAEGTILERLNIEVINIDLTSGRQAEPPVTDAERRFRQQEHPGVNADQN